MGFYDGENRGCSAYSISKLLQVPTLLILDGGGTYITISAILKGLLEYRKDNTIKGVILNNISSQMHYQLIKGRLEQEHNIVVVGWIKKGLPSLANTHLGLNLKDLSKIEQISKEVLEHIDIAKVEKISLRTEPIEAEGYPFPEIKRLNRKLAIVYDANFSFLYYDNLRFLRELYRSVTIIDSTKDEEIPQDCDEVYICGGYVESDEAYAKVKNSLNFKNSLISHSLTKPIYAECAGLLYLSNRVDGKEMSGILDIEFTLGKRFNRLGYYYSERGVKGHAFHYTKPTERSLKKGFDILSKTPHGKGENGSWREGKIFGTYLHTMFRSFSIFV
jgi:cobyrinic acid a,c-diamide synthase